MALASQSDKKMNLKGYLDAMVDKDGIKTEVTITLTNTTLIKTSLYLTGTAFVIIAMVYIARSLSKNTPRTI